VTAGFPNPAPPAIVFPATDDPTKGDPQMHAANLYPGYRDGSGTIAPTAGSS
jgi:hypothetical protein